MLNLKPKDVVAVIFIVCVTFLLFTGYEGPLDNLISLLVGVYFGHRTVGQETGH